VSQTLYDQLGGFSVVRKLVSDFYDKVLDEEDVASFFRDTEMSKLIDHQTKFFATLLGGPASYTDEQLRKLHTSMGIQDHHFDVILDLVQETLEDHDIDKQAVTSIIEKMNTYRSAIVTVGQSGE
jgi:hemoglobin